MVEISTKLVADDVQCERVGCRVDEGEPDAYRLEHVPVAVVRDVTVVPAEQEGVAWKPAYSKDGDEQ